MSSYKSPSCKGSSGSSQRSKKHFLLRCVLKWSVIGLIWAGLGAAVAGLYFAYDLPSLSSLEHSTRQPSITLKTRYGKVFATYGDLYGQTVTVETLPVHVPNAFLAVEDSRFYTHCGIDLWGLIRALYTNYKAGHVVQGGSSITQQLAKNFLFSQKKFSIQDRSMRRKVQELLLTLWLEHKFTKSQILTIYLNRVYFGAGTYGLSAASHKYFSKPPQLLSLYEAAVLAGLLKAPSRYSPLSNPHKTHERAQLVLNRMVEVGFLTPLQRKALKEPPSKGLALKKSAVFGRYFADWILEQVNTYVPHVSEDLIVETTFDPFLQTIAEEKLEKTIREKGKEKAISQGAIVMMTPSGTVGAMVGGYDYRASQFNRAFQALRQPGSSFKLIVFLAALENGFTLTSRISDAPLRLGKWTPKNYKWVSRGDISLEMAFAYSTNTSAVRLAKAVGKNTIAKVAWRLGLSTVRPHDLSIALGSAEVTLLQLTSAFAVFAHSGFKVEPYGILSIKNRQGVFLYRHQGPSPQRLVAKPHVESMLKMMRSVILYGTGKSSKVDYPAVGKSGTSQNYRDAWFVGFTTDLVIGVWLGNDSGKLMNKVSGGSIPAVLWGECINASHKGRPEKQRS